MSALTKTFVVLLVVMSLLSAAGFIVFVNRVDNFRTAKATADAALAQSKADVAAAKSQSAALLTQLDAARRDVDEAQKENARLANDSAEKIAALNSQVAEKDSLARVTAVSLDNATAALTASEAQRKASGDALAAVRTEQDRLNKVVSDNDIAISDLTNRNDVANRKVTDLTEQVAQAQADNQRYTTQLKELGQSPNAAAPDRLALSAPSINGVVRQTGPINGIPYATISVGSAESVQKGMVFNVIDRTRGQFLGVLTIDNVDLHEATGKLEGPAINAVRVGTDVRTQL